MVRRDFCCITGQTACLGSLFDIFMGYEANSSAAPIKRILCHELEAGRFYLELIMSVYKPHSARVSLAPGPCTNGYDTTPWQYPKA